MTDPTNPLIVQGDLTVLLELASPRADDARAALSRFAELERAPEHIHTYRISPLTLWNAAVAGLSPGDVASTLTGFAKYDVAPSVLAEVHDQMGRYGRLRLVRDHDTAALALTSSEPALIEEVSRDKSVALYLGERLDGNRFAVRMGDRGVLKQELLRLGWPVADEAGYDDADDLVPVNMTAELRSYQGDALQSWWADGGEAGGNGVLVLPCGAGKTVIGLGALVTTGLHTLIIATSISSARQWISELLAKTDIDPSLVGEYSSDKKDIRPITVATYQILTHAKRGVPKDADIFERHPHLALFNDHNWGLVIYDEVHLLPAPVFRVTARIQSVRRLGLTATLVREDGREADVFSLIGPKRFDVPWKELELLGWIAPATCTEVRVRLSDDARMQYAMAEPDERPRLAATAAAKFDVLDQLLERHRDDMVLIIGQYVGQLETIAERLGAPLITGKTPQRAREERFQAFRDGDIPVLVVSKVANFSIDLPQANVAIQVSGQFGSRQEEAQRLGRILRPQGGQASFYTLVAAETVEQNFALNRQRFLAEQGYQYDIVDSVV
ncbi:MAG TPA: DEAD/DEAH box helicase [Microthrixaceae bacterium]|nr:DEAD/DEAH box helicase [Microthrixaceae bacterium]